MKKLIDWYNWKSIAALLLIGGIVVYLFFSFWAQFSAFGVAVMFITFGASVLIFVDRYMLKTIDTIEEIKKGNLAYVAFLFVIAYLLVEFTKIGMGL